MTRTLCTPKYSAWPMHENKNNFNESQNRIWICIRSQFTIRTLYSVYDNIYVVLLNSTKILKWRWVNMHPSFSCESDKWEMFERKYCYLLVTKRTEHTNHHDTLNLQWSSCEGKRSMTNGQLPTIATFLSSYLKHSQAVCYCITDDTETSVVGSWKNILKKLPPFWNWMAIKSDSEKY